MRFLLILFIVFLLNAKEYSIQVINTKTLDSYIIKAYNKYKNYPYARIEKIGKYYILRLFQTNKKQSLTLYLKSIQKEYKNAFIKNIKWTKKRIVYPKKYKSIKYKNIFNLIKSKKTQKTKITKQKKSSKITIPIYARLSLDLLKNNKEKTAYLIKKYNKKLPFRDKLEALIRLKRINEAKKIAFENLKNSTDYLTYKQFRDFYVNYANRFNTKNTLVISQNLSYFVNKNSIKYYFLKGYYIYLYNENYFPNKYYNMIIFKLGIKQFLNRGYNFFTIGAKNSSILFLFKNHYPLKQFVSNFYIGKTKTDISNYLLFYGTKTFIKENNTLYITNRNILDSSVSFNRYKEHQNFLGNSILINLKYTRKLRMAYPDFSFYIFTTIAKFSKNINLPQNSYEEGVGYSFGLNQQETYHNNITPFFNIYAYYNNIYKLNLNFLLGINGAVLGHDNLSSSIQYSKSLSGIKNIEYRINYILWF